jgi:hypothetical protein
MPLKPNRQLLFWIKVAYHARTLFPWMSGPSIIWEAWITAENLLSFCISDRSLWLLWYCWFNWRRLPYPHRTKRLDLLREQPFEQSDTANIDAFDIAITAKVMGVQIHEHSFRTKWRSIKDSKQKQSLCMHKHSTAIDVLKRWRHN